jgi:hypothetical protein
MSKVLCKLDCKALVPTVHSEPPSPRPPAYRMRAGLE